MSLISVIYKKDDLDTIVFSGRTDSEVEITGLTAGTVVHEGDFLVAVKDTDTGLVSDKVPVPTFTVLAAAPDAPQQVKAQATDDGAKVSLE